MNSLKVIDASALGAILFAEPDADEIEERVDGAMLLAPALLDFEITNTAVKKFRAKQLPAPQLRAALAMRVRFNVELLKVEFSAIFRLAAEAKLSAYDASYLWIARQFDAELVTLDKRLQAAFASPVGR